MKKAIHVAQILTVVALALFGIYSYISPIYGVWQAVGGDSSKELQIAQEPTATVTVNNTEFAVVVAENDAQRTLGLSGRKELPTNEGMWFTIPESRSESSFFWMKDMLIPIDMIWVNEGKVVWIHENVPTQPGASDNQLISYAAGLPPIYPDRVDSEQELQPLAIDAVLEVAAGVAADSGIQVGDAVTFEKL